ncbi:MAG: hypothetical protein LBG60_07125 [Bifidobacteriaceae bacterium]|jgi:hypothetical protein|nr:hypothetical protein [Bifidobacteriaceae bacterium]
MPNPGQPVSMQVRVNRPPNEAVSRLMFSVSGATGGYFDGVEVTSDGVSFINLQRKYVPTWAVVVGIIGALCALLGLLALLYRDTETCQIRVSPADGGGSLIQVGGVLSPVFHAAIGNAIAALEHGL